MGRHEIIKEASPNKLDDETRTPSVKRIAPSRAHAGATQQFSRVQSTPEVPSPKGALAPSRDSGDGGGGGAGGGGGRARVPTPPPDEPGFGRIGSAAARGFAQFRRTASKVTSVLRVASAGKERGRGGGEDGDVGKDDLGEIKIKPEGRAGGGMFGFQRTLSAPSAPIEDGVARTSCDAAKGDKSTRCIFSKASS